MTGFTIDPCGPFSLVRLTGFAPAHLHAFIVRGEAGARLARGEPIPKDAICTAVGLPGAILHLSRQVHGAGVRVVPEPSGDEAPSAAREADALLTRRPGHAVGVVTADCLPILLAAGPAGCGAVHAGWRGLLAGVIGEAVGRLRAEARLSDEAAPPKVGPPSPAARPRIEAAIGPAIGPCCFEVGEEVASSFRARFPLAPGCVPPGARSGKSTVDLPLAGALALEEAGVDPDGIRIIRLCTRCGDSRLESYRRDGERAGRMVALIGPGAPR